MKTGDMVYVVTYGPGMRYPLVAREQVMRETDTLMTVGKERNRYRKSDGAMIGGEPGTGMGRRPRIYAVDDPAVRPIILAHDRRSLLVAISALVTKLQTVQDSDTLYEDLYKYVDMLRDINKEMDKL